MKARLTIIKLIHTVIWIFFNVVVFYLLYAAITGRIDKWLWIGFGLIATEGIVLICFRLTCPLTLMARRYSDSTKDNFDIYLPNWLAKNTKLIYTSLSVLALLIVLLRTLKIN